MSYSKIYILVGGAGSGKTTLLNLIKSSKKLNATNPIKYSNREKRDESDDIETVPTEEINSSNYSFVYYMQEYFYGFKLDELITPLKNGKNVFIVISDFRVIKEMKAYFGEIVTVLYLFRNMSQFEFEEILKERNENKKIEVNKRSENIRRNRLYLIQRQYIENINIFDQVVLNRKESKNEMLVQVESIVENAFKHNFVKKIKGPVLFLIAAASGSGKKTLMNAMWNLGSNSIKVIQKETNRSSQPDDGPEIITGVKDIDGKYKITYGFNDNIYGIDTDKIWDNLKIGLPQIVITNMQQFNKFKSIFGNISINVYLHSTRTKEEILEFQTIKLKSKEKARKKVDKIDKVHNDYLENITDFHHMLLNTIEKEDLWDQMFNLINEYNARS